MTATPATAPAGRLPRPKSTSRRTRLRSWELNGGLVIRERRNASGSISFRLDIPARVSGHRRILQYRDYHSAAAEADRALANKQQLGQSGFQLTRSQMDDALGAVNILAQFDVTLTEVAHYYARHEKPRAGDITVAKLIEIFIEEKRKGTGAKHGLPLRERSIEDLEYRLGLFAEVHGKLLVKSLREDAIKEWLFHDATLQPATRRNRFRNVRNLLGYAVSRGYLAESPITHLKVGCEDKAPEILTVTQAARLLNESLSRTDLELLPYIALGLFCGIRSEELAKLDWRWVNLQTGLVTIPAAIAKKRRIRNFVMPDCCKAWLLAYGVKQEGLIRPKGFPGRFHTLVKAVGLDKWPHNGLRHSAASYHYAFHSDSSKTCAMLGQRSDDVLFTHYRSLVAPEDAKAFYNLLPPQTGNVIPLAQPQPQLPQPEQPQQPQPIATANL